VSYLSASEVMIHTFTSSPFLRPWACRW